MSRIVYKFGEHLWGGEVNLDEQVVTWLTHTDTYGKPWPSPKLPASEPFTLGSMSTFLERRTSPEFWEWAPEL